MLLLHPPSNAKMRNKRGCFPIFTLMTPTSSPHRRGFPTPAPTRGGGEDDDRKYFVPSDDEAVWTAELFWLSVSAALFALYLLQRKFAPSLVLLRKLPRSLLVRSFASAGSAPREEQAEETRELDPHGHFTRNSVIRSIYLTLMMSEKEMICQVGMDAYLTIRLIRFCLRLSLGFACGCLLFLAPLYHSQPQSVKCKRYCETERQNHNKDSNSPYRAECVCGFIDACSIANIPHDNSSASWFAAWVMTYITGFALYQLRLEYKHVVNLRKRYFLSKPPRIYSVFVDRIPHSLTRRGAGLGAYFERMFPGQLERVEVLNPVGGLLSISERRMQTLEALERAVAMRSRSGKAPKMWVFRGCDGLSGGGTNPARRDGSIAGGGRVVHFHDEENGNERESSDRGNRGKRGNGSSATTRDEDSRDPPRSLPPRTDGVSDLARLPPDLTSMASARPRCWGAFVEVDAVEYHAAALEALNTQYERMKRQLRVSAFKSSSSSSTSTASTTTTTAASSTHHQAETNATEPPLPPPNTTTTLSQISPSRQRMSGSHRLTNRARALRMAASSAIASTATTLLRPLLGPGAGGSSSRGRNSRGRDQGRAGLTGLIANDSDSEEDPDSDVSSSTSSSEDEERAAAAGHEEAARGRISERPREGETDEAAKRARDGGGGGGSSSSSVAGGTGVSRRRHADRPRQAFVTFNRATPPTILAQMLVQDNLRIKPAPDPEDVRWDALGERTTAFSHFSRKAASRTLFALVVLFWGALTSFVGAVTSTEALARQFPELNDFLVDNPGLVGWLDRLTTLIYVVLVAIVHPIISLSVKMEVRISQSNVERASSERYFLFLVVQVFVFYSVAGSVFKSAVDIAQSPSKIFTTLASTIPKNASFFISFLSIKTFWLLFDLNRGYSAILALLRRILKGRTLTPRERRKPYCLCCYDYFFPAPLGLSATTANLLLAFFIATSYAVIQPLLVPVGAVYFAAAAVSYPLVMVSSSAQRFDGGGASWTHNYWCIVAALITAQFTLIGVLFTKRAFGAAVYCMGLAVCSFALAFHISDKYKTPATDVSFELACHLDMRAASLATSSSSSSSASATSGGSAATTADKNKTRVLKPRRQLHNELVPGELDEKEAIGRRARGESAELELSSLSLPPEDADEEEIRVWDYSHPVLLEEDFMGPELNLVASQQGGELGGSRASDYAYTGMIDLDVSNTPARGAAAAGVRSWDGVV